jgi:hypothetical protein
MLQKFRTYSVKISKEAQIIWPSGKQAWMHRYIYVLSIPVQRGNTVAQKIGNSRFSWGQLLISRLTGHLPYHYSTSPVTAFTWT